MAWRPLTTADYKFAPAELAALNAVAGASTGLTASIGVVVREWVGAMAAAGNEVNTDGTVPDQLRRHIIALAVWNWLRDFPKFSFAKTPERQKAAEEADRIYETICRKTYGAIESPSGVQSTGVMWNSQPKIMGRMQPVPLPEQQLQRSPTQVYANPNAPRDNVRVDGGVLAQPNGLQAWNKGTSILLSWLPVPWAESYSIYRATTSGAETLLQADVGETNFQDNTGLTNLTIYYYRVTATNDTGESCASGEASAKLDSSKIP